MLKVIVLALVLVAANGAFTGGWSTGTQADVEDISRWAAKQLGSFQGLEGTYTIRAAKNVQKQVVAGVNYKFTLDVIHQSADNKYTMKSCDLMIFDQPWTNTRRFVKAPSCYQDIQSRAGSWETVDVATDDILNVARLSAKRLNEFGFTGDHNVMVVRGIERQLVSGINYRFTVDYVVAEEDNKYTFKTCNLEVNYKAWSNELTFRQTPVCRVTYKTKSDEVETGSWVDGTIGEVMDLSRWAASQLSQFTGVEGEHTVLTPKFVKKQLVAGINYKFTLDVLIVAPNNQYQIQSCDLNIFVQSWTNTKKFNTTPTCKPGHL